MTDDIRSSDLLTVMEHARRYPNLGSVASLRWQIFWAEQNGLEEAGAIVRRGRRVFVVVPRYLDWILKQGHTRQAA